AEPGAGVSNALSGSDDPGRFAVLRNGSGHSDSHRLSADGLAAPFTRSQAGVFRGTGDYPRSGAGSRRRAGTVSDCAGLSGRAGADAVISANSPPPSTRFNLRRTSSTELVDSLVIR